MTLPVDVGALMADAPVESRGLRQALLRRPLVSAAGLFIAGIFAHRALPDRPGAYLALAGLLLVAATFFHRRALIANGSLATSLVAMGLAGAQLEAFWLRRDDVAHFTADERRLAELELHVIDPPRLIENASQRYRPPRQVTRARVRLVRTTGGWQSAGGVVLLNLDEPRDGLAIGQHLRVLGWLHRPAPAMNPGQFDWAAYCRADGDRIMAAVSAPHQDNVQIVADHGPGLLDRVRAGARQSLGRGFSDGQKLDHSLLQALVFGDTDAQLRDVRDDFLRTGTSHILAISGAHIAILAGLVYLVCRLLFLPPRTAAWVGMAAVLIYGIVAVPSPPVVRSVLLCLAIGLGIVFGRSIDGVQLLALSVLAMLLYHPMDLYGAGFQLSFGTVLGLMVLTRPAIEFIESWRDPHVVVAESFMRPTRWGKVRRWFAHGLRDAIVAGVIAWVVACPLVMYHFDQLNPWAILAGLALALPVTAALACGFAKILLTLLLPWLAPQFAWLAAAPVAAMRHIVDWMANLPAADLAAARPPVWLCAACYILLCLPLLLRGHAARDPGQAWVIRWGARLSHRDLLRFTGPTLALLAPLGLPWLARGPDAPASGTLRVTLLSVGAGQCAVVHLPDGKVVLFDAGTSSPADLTRGTITPYLKHLGINHVDAIAVSHANADHFGAAADVARRHGAGALYCTEDFVHRSERYAAARDLLSVFDAPARSRQVLTAGQSIQLDAQTTLDVLWPPAGTDDSSIAANDTSLVLRLTCRGRVILFTGDIQAAAERELLRDPSALKCEFLVAPHHGSSEQTTAEFLAACSPKYLLGSNDASLTAKQRRFDAIAGEAAVPLLRTHSSGAISVDVDRDGQLTVTTFRKSH